MTAAADEGSLHRRTRGGLRDLGVRPRKALGQNFLVTESFAERIVAAADVQGRDVLEIGPGMGALSERLAMRAARLTLLEIEARMAERLRERFAGADHVRVVTGDALSADLAALVEGPGRGVVVANLPYSVASPILLRLLDASDRYQRLVLMLQREVAERLVAAPGGKDYGLPSIWVALRGTARILFRVPPGAFVPRPKVESAVVAIELGTAPRVALSDEARFRTLVRAAFAQRRKTLRAALGKLASESLFERAGIDGRRRGETLSIEEFARLANETESPPHA